METNTRHSEQDKNWPKDEFGRHEVTQFWWWILLPLLALLAAFLFSRLTGGAGRARGEVIVYCAQDQTYAEPILREYERSTGIRVRAVYDSEAVKTVGLANRLLAEREHPRCDVFWGNEEMRTRQLAALGVWRATNGFSTFGARMRCLVINTHLLPVTTQPGPGDPDLRGPTPALDAQTWQPALPNVPPLPTSLLDLTNAAWRGRVAMAFPQFGTTATHFHVLRQLWGDALWRQWCLGLVANDVQVLDGNSAVVRQVGRGDAWLGLTDTDDVLAGQRNGWPVARGPEPAGSLLFIPNTVASVRGAPHPDAAQGLASHLTRPEVVEELISAGALQYARVPSNLPGTLHPDWGPLLKDLESTTESLNRIFLK